MRLRKGDKVIVITGKYKGQTGQIAEIDHTRQRVMISGIKIKKHNKPEKDEEKGKINEIYAPIPVSNVAFLDPKLKTKPTRIRYEIFDQKKIRVATLSGKKIINNG